MGCGCLRGHSGVSRRGREGGAGCLSASHRRGSRAISFRGFPGRFAGTDSLRVGGSVLGQTDRPLRPPPRCDGGNADYCGRNVLVSAKQECSPAQPLLRGIEWDWHRLDRFCIGSDPGQSLVRQAPRPGDRNFWSSGLRRPIGLLAGARQSLSKSRVAYHICLDRRGGSCGRHTCGFVRSQ